MKFVIPPESKSHDHFRDEKIGVPSDYFRIWDYLIILRDYLKLREKDDDDLAKARVELEKLKNEKHLYVGKNVTDAKKKAVSLIFCWCFSVFTNILYFRGLNHKS